MLASERETIEKIVNTVLCLLKHYLIYFKRNDKKILKVIKSPIKYSIITKIKLTLYH